MSCDEKRLWELLPALYRLRDEAQGGPLRSLLSVIAGQIQVLEENLDQLYDDQFIETCADWVVPYIGDLIGYRKLHGVVPKVSSPRAEVANTMAYRRRKGTACVLEQLARDVTGWDARVVEFFQLLATTQYLNHLRPRNLSMVRIGQPEPLDRLNTPFDTMAHTIDVRSIARGRGLHNIPNIGIFLWRIQARPLTDVQAFKVDDNRYLFNPLGMDTQLFTKPEPEEEITHIAERMNVPMPISRRVLAEYVQDYYGMNKSLLIRVDGREITSDRLVVCDLSDKDATGQWANKALEEDPEKNIEARIVIDPVLGRMAFPESLKPKPDEAVTATYHYGFGADMGGGEYERGGLGKPTTRIASGGDTLAQALAAAGQDDVIEIEDSGTNEWTGEVHLASGQKVTVQAKDKKRAVISGSLTIWAADESAVTIDGVMITGAVEVRGEEEMTLVLRHCTLKPSFKQAHEEPQSPPEPSLIWQERGSSGKCVIQKSITGRLVISEGISVSIEDSIIDGCIEDSFALAGAGDGKDPAGETLVVRSTVIGSVHVREVDLVEDSIVTGRFRSDRLQVGCVRFSYMHEASEAPRRYHCEPDLAIDRMIEKAKREKEILSSKEKIAIAGYIRERIRPVFTSLTYGAPGYCQLSRQCAVEIRQGADNGSEMGAFCDLRQPQRETNLRIRIEEYLRFGLEAGIMYAS